MKIKSIKYNCTMNMIKNVMAIIFPLITFPYVSRILLQEGVGRANYVASIISYFQLIASLGINNYAITEGAKIKNNKRKLNHFSTEILLINLISTVISYTLLFIVINLPIFKNYKFLILISSINIIFTTIGIEWIYSIVEEYEYITIRSIFFQFLSLILLFIFVREKNDVAQYVGLSVVATSGSAIINFVHSRNYIILFKESFITYNLKKHLTPIMTIFGMSISATVYLNADIIMLGFMKGDAAVGVYTAAIKINKVICILVLSLSAVILSRLSYYIASDDFGKFFTLVKRATHFMLILVAPCIPIMYLLSKEIITIVSGEAFLIAVPTMKIMVFNLFLSPINGFIANQIFMSLRREKISLYATIAGALINLTLNCILIPRFSYKGAAFSTIIAESIVFLICLPQANRLIDIKSIFEGWWQYVVSSLPIILVYYFVGWCGITNIILRSFLITFIGMIVYIMCLIRFKNRYILEATGLIKAKFNN